MMIATVRRFIQELSRPAYTLGTDMPEADLRGLLQGVSRRKGADAPCSRVRNFPGVVFLKYGGGIFENIPEKCGIFVIYRILIYSLVRRILA